MVRSLTTCALGKTPELLYVVLLPQVTNTARFILKERVIFAVPAAVLVVSFALELVGGEDGEDALL